MWDSNGLDPFSPYYYLVDYQERITDGTFYAYKRTIEKINDVSRISENRTLYRKTCILRYSKKARTRIINSTS